jgi:hypothetical protein
MKSMEQTKQQPLKYKLCTYGKMFNVSVFSKLENDMTG